MLPLQESTMIEGGEGKDKDEAGISSDREYVKLIVSHPLLFAYEEHLQELQKENFELHKSQDALKDVNKNLELEIKKAEE